MTKEEREHRIAYAERQFEVHKMQALHAQAMALTGAATLRKLQRGREPTEEERSKGMCIGFSEISDMEKIQTSLEEMQNHIHIMVEINDKIDELRRDV